MQGEGKRQDYKLTFDASNPAALLELIKHIIAFANTGGGEIVFGRDETRAVGIQPEAAALLDSSRLGDAVDKYIEKGLIHLSHNQEALPNGSVLVTLAVEASPYPAVIGKDGTVAGPGKTQQSVLRRGDLWVRHGSRTERVSQADLRAWTEAAYNRGVERIMSAAQVVREAGPARSIELRTREGETFRSPSDLLDDALRRKALGLPYLLSGRELLWGFTRRRSLPLTQDQLELLIESALRRPVTLHWWLLDPRVDGQMVAALLDRLIEAQDRDKSDAAKSAVELAAVYLDKAKRKGLLDRLRSSRYAHFRKAAAGYRGAEHVEAGLRRRARRQAPDGRPFEEMTSIELERLADETAARELQAPSRSGARALSDALIALWLREGGRGSVGGPPRSRRKPNPPAPRAASGQRE
jgi:hypothetical protein